MIKDQHDVVQVEPLMHRGYEVMNYYLLYNQTFITVHESNVVQSFRLMSIWFSIVNQVHMFLTVSNSHVFVLQDY